MMQTGYAQHGQRGIGLQGLSAHLQRFSIILLLHQPLHLHTFMEQTVVACHKAHHDNHHHHLEEVEPHILGKPAAAMRLLLQRFQLPDDPYRSAESQKAQGSHYPPGTEGMMNIHIRRNVGDDGENQEGRKIRKSMKAALYLS